jgi:hypothetical protein
MQGSIQRSKNHHPILPEKYFPPSVVRMLIVPIHLYIFFAVLWNRNYFFSDPDPAMGLISDSDPDPACLTKVIRLYKIKL